MQKGISGPKVPARMKDTKLYYHCIDWKPVKLKTRNIVAMEHPGAQDGERVLWQPTVRTDGCMSIVNKFK